MYQLTVLLFQCNVEKGDEGELLEVKTYMQWNVCHTDQLVRVSLGD